jgi:hypothetical protein
MREYENIFYRGNGYNQHGSLKAIVVIAHGERAIDKVNIGDKLCIVRVPPEPPQMLPRHSTLDFIRLSLKKSPTFL